MIREYEEKDLNILMKIGNNAWKSIYESLEKVYGQEVFDTYIGNPKIAKGEQIRRHCESYPHWTFVAERDGKIVGFITCFIDYDKKTGEIANNAVDVNCSLKGIGQEMYQFILQFFKDEGLKIARVGTGLDEGHAPARKAYERAGFDIKHEDVIYYKVL